MVFRLEVLPAHKGDCLILHYGEAPAPALILIDGGPSRTYAPHLRPRIMGLRQERGLREDQPLFFEAVMVSHLDDDHINGILDLTRELRETKARMEPPIVEVGTLWHNGFDDIIGNNEILHAAARVEAGAAALASMEHDSSQIFASLAQGRTLRDDAAVLGWSLNSGLGPILSVSEETRDAIAFPGDLELVLVGPRQSEIEALQERHDRFLRERGLGRDDPQAALAALTDKSVPNLSSLVALARFGDRTMLLTGDARSDNMLLGLEEQGLIEPGGTLEVDVLKMMHHGSDRNVNEDFLSRVRARHYVFSGDGKHGNPERGCLEMLFRARPEGDYTLHFTYEIDEIDDVRREEAGAGWTPREHGLAAAIANARAAGTAFAVNTPAGRESRAIDL